MRKSRIVSIVAYVVPLVLLTTAAVRRGDAASPHATPTVTGWEIVTEETAIENVNVHIGVATCPIGKQVLGGGYLVFPVTSPIGDELRRVAVVDSHPFPGHPVADSWRVRAIRMNPSVGAWGLR